MYVWLTKGDGDGNAGNHERPIGRNIQPCAKRIRALHFRPVLMCEGGHELA